MYLFSILNVMYLSTINIIKEYKISDVVDVRFCSIIAFITKISKVNLNMFRQ